MPEASQSIEPLEILLAPVRDGYRLVAPELHRRVYERAEQDRLEAAAPEDDEAGAVRRAFRASARGYRRLTGRRRAREGLLKDLAEPRPLTVRHPSGLGQDSAERVYRELLERQWKKHKRWMIVNGVLLPPSALLTLIPGPNLVAGYLAWRAFEHNKARSGSKAGLAAEAVTFAPEPLLDELKTLQERRFALGRRRKLREIGHRLGVPELDRAL